MTPGSPIESLTPDDLREACPTCNGTGVDPSSAPAQTNPGFDHRTLPTPPSECRHRLCVGGKVPSAIGRAILKLCQDYDRPDKRII